MLGSNTMKLDYILEDLLNLINCMIYSVE